MQMHNGIGGRRPVIKVLITVRPVLEETVKKKKPHVETQSCCHASEIVIEFLSLLTPCNQNKYSRVA